jgi:hypothetical protein
MSDPPPGPQEEPEEHAMSDPPPEWGEPRYLPPEQPSKPKATLRPGQRQALWSALILVVLGQAAYWVGFGSPGTSTGGTATANGTCCTGPLYVHPVVAAAGFLVSVGALALVVGAVARSWSALRSSGFVIVVPILAALGLGLEMVAPLGCACF